jgi:hypothetical protein
MLPMNGVQKVLVVDSGERSAEGAVSAQLAEMGLASVTAPLAAAEEILELIPSPTAVVFQIPASANFEERRSYLRLADRVRAAGVPVLVIGENDAAGGQAALLQSDLSARVLSQAAL